MVYKPMSVKMFKSYIKAVGWKLEKGSIDWNLYDGSEAFICSIKIAHGKYTKEEIIADSVNKTKKAFKNRGLTWPPVKKKN
jgi:hypothetical protein